MSPITSHSITKKQLHQPHTLLDLYNLSKPPVPQ